MATFCPCGCGVKVGFSTRGAAAGAQRMTNIVSVILPLAQEDSEKGAMDSETEAMVSGFLGVALKTREFFLDHVHKTARPGVTPDLLELKRMLDICSKAAMETVDIASASRESFPVAEWQPKGRGDDPYGRR